MRVGTRLFRKQIMITTRIFFYYGKKLVCVIFLVLTSVFLYLITWKTHSDSIVMRRITAGDTLQRIINESERLQDIMRAEIQRNQKRKYGLGNFNIEQTMENQVLLDMKKAGLTAIRKSLRHSIPALRLDDVTGPTHVLAKIRMTSLQSRTGSSTSHNELQTNDMNDVLVVPNVVHYIWLGTALKFRFLHYLSLLSVHRYIKPDYIFVHGEVGPTGQWWNRTIQDVDNIFHVKKMAAEFAPSGRRFAFFTHSSDLLRLQTMYNFGGIYLDIDVLVVKSFDPLRRYQTVLGRESFHGICMGIIVSAKHAPFTWMLLEQYKDYSGLAEWWSYRAVLVPHMLAAKFPELVHVEETSLNRPNWYELDKIYYEHYDWSENYAMHMWFRSQGNKDPRRLPEQPADIDCVETTFGEIARHILYGSKKLRCLE